MKLLNVITKDKLSVIISLFVLILTALSVQNFYPSDDTSTKLNTKFTLFPFAINDTSTLDIKTAFFAKDPYAEFLKLKSSKNILFASSASFTSSIKSENNFPVGFCAENGEILNKMPHQTMDGLVIISNELQDFNSIKVIDLDKTSDNCNVSECDNHFPHSNIRDNLNETYSFISAVKKYKLSGFQTQLVYTKFKSDKENFELLFNGNNDRARRFLAICEKDNVLHHVIVDALNKDFLMASAKEAIMFLRASNYNVDFMLNLDTGSKDIMYAHDGEDFKNLRPNPITSSAKIENASSLLVYYTEKQ